MKEIAIIYTTFLRPALAQKTLLSIYENWQDNFFLLIADQGEEKDYISTFSIDKGPVGFLEKIKYFPLPFDCGLSYARNLMIEKAIEMNIDYCLISADSIRFTPYTIEKLKAAISYLKVNNTGILGFDLKNRTPWEYFMDLKDGHFILKKTDKLMVDKKTGLNIKECEICRNFFLAKTKALATVKWDNELKLCEHEDFFWRFKQSGYKTTWTSDISAEYINDKPARYGEFRNRMYNEYLRLLQKKYRLSGWVMYEKG